MTRRSSLQQLLDAHSVLLQVQLEDISVSSTVQCHRGKGVSEAARPARPYCATLQLHSALAATMEADGRLPVVCPSPWQPASGLHNLAV